MNQAGVDGADNDGTPPALFCLQGSPRVLHAESGQWRPLPRKAAALLARVVLDGAASRETLAAELWPDQSGDKPRVNLRGLLRDLRALSGRDLLLGSTTLSLAEGVTHDLQLAADDTAPLLGALSFSDLDSFNDWLMQARHRRRSARLQHWRDQLASLEADGALPLAVQAAERLLTEDATDEAAWRSLMRLLYRRGDSAAALATYACCRQQLQQALQVEPAPATRALALLIESGEPLPARAVQRLDFAAFQPRRLAGRAAELSTIAQAWAQAQPVLLLGESGSGKTRLLQHLAQTTPAVQVAACDGDAEQPYALLVRLLGALLEHSRPTLPSSVREELARLRPEFGAPPDRPARTWRLAEALAAALAQWRAGGLRAVLLDDVHWADSASLHLVQQLLFDLTAATAPAEPLAWLLAQRAQEPHAALAPVVAATADLWCRLSLQPLDDNAVAELLRATDAAPRDAPAWAALLTRPCGGNPLLLIETLQALHTRGLLSQAVPQALPWPETASLPGLLASRLARLDGRELHLAQLAALAGGLFSAPMALQVLGCTALDLGSTWQALEAAGVLQGTALRHDSLRAPLLARLPQPLTVELHASVATSAQQAGAEAAEVARHWLAARAWGPAAQCLQHAAERAGRLNARREAMLLWQQAADAHARLGRDEPAFNARVQAFDAALEVLPWTDAQAQAQALQQAAHTPEQVWAADMAQARVSLTGYHYADAVKHARRAVDAAGLFAVGDERALRAGMLWCAALAGSGRQAEALETLQAQHQAALQSHDLRLQLDHHGTRGYVFSWAGQWQASHDSYARALDLAESLDDAAEAATLAANLAVSLTRRGDCEAAYRRAHQGVLWRARLDKADGLASAMALQGLAVICLRLMRCDEALAALQQALQVAGDGAPQRLRLSCDVALANTWVELGRPDLARAALPTGQPTGAGWLPHALALAAIEAAEGADPMPGLLAARAKGAAEPDIHRWCLDLRLADRTAPEQALPMCRQVADQAAAAGALSAEQAAWLREAETLRRLGDPAAALARLRPALQRRADCHPLDMSQGEHWLIAAQVLHDGGCMAERDTVLQQASTWLTDHALPHVPVQHRNSFLQRPMLQRLLALLLLRGT